MVNDHKTQSEWEIELTVQINFISFKDSEETRNMHIKSCICIFRVSSESLEEIKLYMKL